jgi:opacity protein-like surface antigen
LQPYVNFSFGPAVPHLELNTNRNREIKGQAYSFQSSMKNWGGGLGAGVRYKISRRFGLYLEYKLTYSHLHGMRFDDMDNTNVNMDFWTHHLQWGLSVMFNV